MRYGPNNLVFQTAVFFFLRRGRSWAWTGFFESIFFLGEDRERCECGGIWALREREINDVNACGEVYLTVIGGGGGRGGGGGVGGGG